MTLKVYNTETNPTVEPFVQPEQDLVIYQMIDRIDDLNVQQVFVNQSLHTIVERLNEMHLEQLQTQKKFIEVGFAYTVIIAATMVLIGVLS